MTDWGSVASYHNSEVTKYQNIKNKITALSGNLDNCSIKVTEVCQYTDNIIISGQSIDEGSLEGIKTSVSQIYTNLTPLIVECNKKIQYHQKKYDEAIANQRTAMFSEK